MVTRYHPCGRHYMSGGVLRIKLEMKGPCKKWAPQHAFNGKKSSRFKDRWIKIQVYRHTVRKSEESKARVDRTRHGVKNKVSSARLVQHRRSSNPRLTIEISYLLRRDAVITLNLLCRQSGTEWKPMLAKCPSHGINDSPFCNPTDISLKHRAIISRTTRSRQQV